MITKAQFASMVQVGIEDNADFYQVATTANKIAKAFGKIRLKFWNLRLLTPSGYCGAPDARRNPATFLRLT